jgi:hypothetical protein
MKHFDILLCAIVILLGVFAKFEYSENAILKETVERNKKEKEGLQIEIGKMELSKTELIILGIDSQIQLLELVAKLDPPNTINALNLIEQAKNQKRKLEHFKNEKMNALAITARSNSS